MLDSSPVALPPAPRPLKRSASTASLLTPPRTSHKRKQHRKSKGSYESDTDSGSSASESEEGKDGCVHKSKKRRTSEPNEADEEAFWMNTSSSKTRSSKTASSRSTTASKTNSPAAPLLYRRLQNNTEPVAPVSPPPSNRKKAILQMTPTTAVSSPGSPPVTPEPKRPMRDSPNNPFLEDPDVYDSASPNNSPGPRTPYQEKPTVTYVFRGVRGTFPNPLYDHAKNQPISPSANSRLPPEHPDYSPSSHCPPRLLFPSARRRSLRLTKKPNMLVKHGSPSRNKQRQRSVSVSGFDSEDEDVVIVPKKLNFRAGEEDGENSRSLQEEMEAAGA